MGDAILSPQVISRIMGEIRDLNKKPVEGIAFLDNGENSVTEVHAVITGPESTPFHRGKFRMKLVLSHDYPSSPPRGFFLTKIYHPNVSSNGDICVNTLKKDWTPETSLKHVLQVIRCLLIVPFPESSLNDEAGKLFMDSYDEFARRARLMTDVHAIDETEENEEDGREDATSAGVAGKTDITGNVSSSAADDVENAKTNGVQSVFVGSDKLMEKVKTKKASDKTKEEKKKSLKRL